MDERAAGSSQLDHARASWAARVQVGSQLNIARRVELRVTQCSPSSPAPTPGRGRPPTRRTRSSTGGSRAGDAGAGGLCASGAAARAAGRRSAHRLVACRPTARDFKPNFLRADPALHRHRRVVALRLAQRHGAPRGAAMCGRRPPRDPDARRLGAPSPRRRRGSLGRARSGGSTAARRARRRRRAAAAPSRRRDCCQRRRSLAAVALARPARPPRRRCSGRGRRWRSSSGSSPSSRSPPPLRTTAPCTLTPRDSAAQFGAQFGAILLRNSPTPSPYHHCRYARIKGGSGMSTYRGEKVQSAASAEFTELWGQAGSAAETLELIAWTWLLLALFEITGIDYSDLFKLVLLIGMYTLNMPRLFAPLHMSFATLFVYGMLLFGSLDTARAAQFAILAHIVVLMFVRFQARAPTHAYPRRHPTTTTSSDPRLLTCTGRAAPVGDPQSRRRHHRPATVRIPAPRRPLRMGERARRRLRPPHLRISHRRGLRPLLARARASATAEV